MKSELQARKAFPYLCALYMKAVSGTFTNLACMLVAYCKGWMNPLGIVVSVAPASSASLFLVPVFFGVQAVADTATTSKYLQQLTL
jgi:hypothetical protein